MGRYRDLTDAEIKELNELIEPSSKTEEASLPRTETPKKENRIHQKRRPQVQEKRRLLNFNTPLSFVSKKSL
jgi:23S rRNA pseudouridine2604 synthase